MKKFTKTELIDMLRNEYLSLYNKGLCSRIPLSELPHHIHIIKKIYDYTHDQCKYLDVSIGSGFVARILKKSGIDVYGINGIFGPNEGKSRREFRKKFAETGISLYEAKIESEKLPFSDNEFDIIYWGATIEHLQNSPKKPMDEMYSKLKPGGIFIIDTPNVTSLRHRILILLGISFMPSIERVYNSYFHGFHHREYTMKDLIKVCKWTGYEILEAEYEDTLWPLSLKKFGKLAAYRSSEQEKSIFDMGFDWKNWYDYIKLIPMGLCKLFPSLRETLVVVCKKNDGDIGYNK